MGTKLAWPFGTQSVVDALALELALVLTALIGILVAIYCDTSILASLETPLSSQFGGLSKPGNAADSSSNGGVESVGKGSENMAFEPSIDSDLRL